MHDASDVCSMPVELVYAAIAIVVESVGFIRGLKIVVYEIIAKRLNIVGECRVIQLNPCIQDRNETASTLAKAMGRFKLQRPGRALVIHRGFITPTINAV